MNRRKRVRPSRGVSCMKIIKWLDLHFEEFFMVVFLVLITVVSLMQVIVRNIEVIPSLTWAEEFCRFCWIGSVFLSLPYTIRNISMLRVCVLLDLLPETVHKLINIATYFITAACMALLAYYSVDVVSYLMESGEVSPAMQWPMWAVYSTMLIGFALGIARGIQQGILHIMHFSQKELTTLEQTMQDAAQEAAAGKRMEGGAD